MILVTLLQAKLCAILLLVITVAAFAPPFHSSGGRSNYYMGAVAEHTTYMDEVSSSESLLDINLSLYEKFIALASDNGAQVKLNSYE